jgi:catechol 2,3-dioxygenase-like lactoylglutathione lyase family enzyme
MCRIAGIHHLKFAVADLERSLQFYESVFDVKRLSALDHRRPGGELFAMIVDFPDLGAPLELRLDPAAACAQKGFDPVTFSVQSNDDLSRWCTRLDELEVPHSPVLNGFAGQLIVIEDPDGRRLRLYSLEPQGAGVKPSVDARWLG